MKVLITGCTGQLGWELQQTCPHNVDITALDATQLDITNKAVVNEVLISLSPDIVINAAAYTAVDKAETEIDIAKAVNETGSENLALVCKDINAKLIHVSTDFVFDGTKTSPYQTDDTPNPINVYGATKLAGDIKVSNILGNQAVIIRTAWVYSTHGNNFVKTMLKLMQEREELGIVYDQVGTPTWAKGLAKMIWSLADKMYRTNDHSEIKQKSLGHSGIEERDIQNLKTPIIHWTDAGVTSWYDFAIAIEELALEKGMLKKSISIKPIPASNYPTPAKRPSFSVINKASAEALSGVQTVHWRKQLSAMLDQLKA